MRGCYQPRRSIRKVKIKPEEVYLYCVTLLENNNVLAVLTRAYHADTRRVKCMGAMTGFESMALDF